MGGRHAVLLYRRGEHRLDHRWVGDVDPERRVELRVATQRGVLGHHLVEAAEHCSGRDHYDGPWGGQLHPSDVPVMHFAP